MSNYSTIDPASSQSSPQPFLPIPLSQPFFTYILLVAIIVVWGAMEIYGFALTGSFGGSQDATILRLFGANDGELILRKGQIWRLFTSMFLHVGFAHLAFNAYALLIFGFEMERIYGPGRYIIIYVLSGLFGSLASFASRGPIVLSAGASGAIFGLIGMNLAFFLIHRQTFGEFGRSRVMSTLIIIGINLAFGFTVPRIDNMAHLGGLMAGFALGYALAPQYQLVGQYTTSPRVIDTVSWLNRWWVVALTAIIFGGSAWATTFIWSQLL